MTSMMNTRHGGEVRIYADACSHRFALRREGETWVREFSSLPAAIQFVTELPYEGDLRIILHDDQGLPLTRLILRSS
jgi:hypothetical protein